MLQAAYSLNVLTNEESTLFLMILIRLIQDVWRGVMTATEKPRLVCLEPLNGDLVKYVDLDLHPEHDGQMFC